MRPIPVVNFIWNYNIPWLNRIGTYKLDEDSMSEKCSNVNAKDVMIRALLMGSCPFPFPFLSIACKK